MSHNPGYTPPILKSSNTKREIAYLIQDKTKTLYNYRERILELKKELAQLENLSKQTENVISDFNMIMSELHDR